MEWRDDGRDGESRGIMGAVRKHQGATERRGKSVNPITANNPPSIQTWALEEARRRLEAEGILTDPDTVKKE